ncbi:MAG TPA: MFS transporter [Dehalococcoidales bacterium]
MKRLIRSELVMVMAIMGLSVMAMAVLQPVLPLYLTSININPTTLGLMFSVAMVGMVLGESTGGWIADKAGLKIPLAVGTFLCAPVVFAFTLTRNTSAIFLIFLFWGIFRAAIFGPARGYIGTTVPFANKATFMAIYAATLSVARSLGALMSGFIADNLGYDWNFFISTGISVIAGLLVVVGLRKIPLVRGRPALPPSPTGQSPSPKLSNSYRPFIVQSMVAALVFLGMGVTSFLPLLATQVAGVQATEVGILFTIGGLFTAALLIPLGQLADRKGKRVLMIIGLVVSAIGYAGYASAHNFAWLIGSIVISSFGQAMFSPAAVALLSDTVPIHWQNTAMGVYGACEDIGAIAGSALGGVVWTAWEPPATFVMGAISLGVGAVICFSLIKEKVSRSPTN